MSELKVVSELEIGSKALLHTYCDDTAVEYSKEPDGSFLAKFSKVREEQYKASQKHCPADTFLLSLFG